ncbi:hypothetical protein RB195_014407 [Necator americanus]|uniref:Uncharacterized protein n=1 Tax=Necator americanus TaxID=51031 RepID=A0ABR1E063_NECAM
MTRERYQHLAPSSKVATENRLRFFGHILRRPTDRLVPEEFVGFELKEATWPKTEVLEPSQKIEKVGQNYVQGLLTSAKMWVIPSGDDICRRLDQVKR